jgi:VIT1/CCC1 family predicted Fe2+/Mn2+ transporter
VPFDGTRSKSSRSRPLSRAYQRARASIVPRGDRPSGDRVARHPARTPMRTTCRGRERSHAAARGAHRRPADEHERADRRTPAVLAIELIVACRCCSPRSYLMSRHWLVTLSSSLLVITLVTYSVPVFVTALVTVFVTTSVTALVTVLVTVLVTMFITQISYSSQR